VWGSNWHTRTSEHRTTALLFDLLAAGAQPGNSSHLVENLKTLSVANRLISPPLRNCGLLQRRLTK